MKKCKEEKIKEEVCPICKGKGEYPLNYGWETSYLYCHCPKGQEKKNQPKDRL